MPPIDQTAHRCPTHVSMPLADAVALGRIAEAWANFAPEVLSGEFQTATGTITVNTASRQVTYDPRPQDAKF